MQSASVATPSAAERVDVADGALVQLRAYISQGGFAIDDRLPAERTLCETLGVGRSELRRALAILEAEGSVWRHVGRGTFIGDGPQPGGDASIAAIARRTTPQEVMRARLLLEPMLCAEAAMHATAEHVDALRELARKSRRVATWREYEVLDNRFHRTIAEAARNTPLVAMFDQLNALRRTVAWGRLRERRDSPPNDHHSFAEHEAILGAIEQRDAGLSEAGMRRHLQSVSASMFPA